MRLSRPCVWLKVIEMGQEEEGSPPLHGVGLGAGPSFTEDRCFGTEGSGIVQVGGQCPLGHGILVHSRQKEQHVESGICLSPDSVRAPLPEPRKRLPGSSG